MNNVNRFAPAIKVPGLLSDEALQEQLRQFRSSQNDVQRASPPPSSAVEATQRIMAEWVDTPLRRTLRNTSALAPAPISGLLSLGGAAAGVREMSPEAQANAVKNEALQRRSDLLANSPEGAVGLSLLSPGGFLLSEFSPLSRMGALTAEESQADADRRLETARKAEAATRSHADTREKLRGLTTEQAAQLGIPTGPLDGETLAEIQTGERAADALRVRTASEETQGAERVAADPKEQAKQTWWLNAMRSAYKGATGIGTSVVKAPLAVLEAGFGSENAEAARAWVQTAEVTLDKMLPGDKARSKDFITELAAGGGSMVGFMLGGYMAQAVGLPAAVGTAALGFLSSGSQQFEDAESFNADAMTKLLAFVVGGTIGLSEALPIDRMLLRAEKATGGLVSRMLRNTLAGSAEEFIQEFGQAIGEDVVAQWLYDAQREIDLRAAARQGLIGGITGGLAGGATSILAESGVLANEPRGRADPLDQLAPAERERIVEVYAADVQAEIDRILQPLEPETVQPNEAADAMLAMELEAAVPVGPEAATAVEPETLQPVGPEAATAVDPEAATAVEPETLQPVGPETATAVDPEQVAADIAARVAAEPVPITQIATEFADALERTPLFDHPTVEARGGVVPAPDENGSIILRHWSPAPRATIDPAQRGTGPLTGDERARLAGPEAVDRSYYGVRSGPERQAPAVSESDYSKLTDAEKRAVRALPNVDQKRVRTALRERYNRETRSGGYRPEGLGSYLHEVEVKPDDLYNARQDPLGLRAQLPADASSAERSTLYERLIRDAGFRGVYYDSSALGQTAILFEPATPRAVIDERFGRPVSELATRQDFEAGATPETFQRGGWAVVTATREALGPWDAPENVAANERLRRRLQRQRIDFIEVEGAYQGEPQGTSFLVFMPEDRAADLGAQLQQESILTNEGLVYTDGSGRIVPALHDQTIVGPEAEQADFFSKLPDGTAFTMGLDWGAEAGQSEESDAGLLANRQPVRTETLPLFPDRADQSFDRWFRDSKVVGEDGAPLVVYHGTPTPGFNAFDPDRTGTTTVLFSAIETHRQGFFFAEDEGFARGFADQRPGGDVMPVFLRVENPFDAREFDRNTRIATERVVERIKELDPEYNTDFFHERVGSDAMWEVFDTPEQGDVVVQALKDSGFDGVRMIEPNHDTGESETVWAVFEPTQVKSAVTNTGAYSPSNPDVFAQTSQGRKPLRGEQTRRKQGVAGATDPALDTLSLANIARNFTRVVDAAVRQGRFTLKGADILGQYDRRQDTIRIRSWNDLSTLVHEAGHEIEAKAGAELKQFVMQNDALLKDAARRLYGGYDKSMPEPTKRAEGFAEFFRIYVLNRKYAEAKFTTLTNGLDAVLDQTAPEMRRSLELVGEQFTAWLQLPSAQIVRNMIVSGLQADGVNAALEEIGEEGFPTWFREVYRRSVDATINRYTQLDLLVSDLLNIGQREQGVAIDLKRAEDPGTLIRLAANSGSRAMVQATDGVMGYQSVAPMSRSLREALLRYHGLPADRNLKRLDPVRQRDFAAYIVALRGIDEYRRLAEGKIERPPMAATLADLRIAVREMEAQYGNDFVEAAQIVHEYGMALWQKSYDAGLISKQTYKDGLDRQFYAPLQRDISDKALTQGEIGASAQQGRSIVRQFRGSDRDIIDPMDILMHKTFALERVIAENEVKRSLARLADRAGRAGALVERVPARKLLGTEYSVQEVARQLTRDDTLSEADAHDLMEILETSIEEGNRVALFRSQQAVAAGENVVFFWEDGKLAALQIRDGDVGADIVNTMNGIGRESMPLFMDAVANVATVFRASITSWPDFLLVNFIRDQMSAWILTDVGYKPFATGLRGTGDELRQSDWARQYNAAMGAMGGMNVAAMHEARVNRDISTLRSKGYLVRAFQGSGIRGALQGLSKVVEATETGTRIGVYRKAYERGKADGLTDWEAAVEASYVATDIANFGLNGSRMLAWRRTIPFLNAQLQGLYKMMRVMSGDEVRRRKGMLFAVRAFFKNVEGMDLSRTEKAAVQTGRKAWLKMASLGFVGALLHFLFEDDPDYQNASEYLRATGWVIPAGDGTIFYIPKPFELAFVSNIVERAFESASGDGEAKNRLLRGFGMTLVPPLSSPVGNIVTEQMANYQFFSGTEIVPDHMRALAPELQYNHYTTSFAKQLGEAMGWSPMRIDHALNGLGASAYRDVMFAYNATDPDRPSSDPTDWPITRRFVRDARRGSTVSRDFWAYASTVDGSLRRAEVSYRRYIDEGREDAADAFLQTQDEDARAFALLSAHFKAEAKRLHPMYRARQLATVVSGIRREIVSPLGLESTQTKLGGQITLTAREKAEVDDLLSEYIHREIRNTMIYMETPGWNGKAALPVEQTLDLLLTASPDVADELERRIAKAKVYSEDFVRDYWPEARDRLLTDRQDAFLNDLLTIAKATAR